MDAQTLDALAKGLSEAQSRFMLALVPMAGCRAPDEPNYRGFTYSTGDRIRHGLSSALALSRRGIVNRSPRGGPEAYETGRMGFVWLTADGLALRDRLLAKGEGCK